MPSGNDINLGPIAGTGKSLVFPRENRDKHLYVSGVTGTGKSKFLEHLIRQDIRGWYKSGSGLLLLDPHGSLYDSILAWLARSDAVRLPVIPIDLRQDDWVVCYNALRHRDIPDPSVVIENFVQAMAHVWGESGTDRTPRFARWATNVLRTLYENGMTLLEAEYLIDHLDRDGRVALMRKLLNRSCLRDWRFANELKPRDFETELGSTVNRLRVFVENEYLRNIFGNSKVSLDLGRSLEEGHIILVCLASARARVSEKDASLFATLILTDLWNAALARGKRPGVKPFYLYLDEFQRFVTPTIAQNLDEARGFGLHLTMANQYPQQLLDQGEQGTRLYHSVMENACSKVVFRLQTEDNLKPLAQWLFRGTMNADEIKLRLDSTKVVGHREVERVSWTEGASRSTGTTATESNSLVETNGMTASESESEGLSRLEDIYGEELARQIHATGGAGHGTTSTASSGYQESTAHTESVTELLSKTVQKVLVPVMGTEVSHIQFRTLEEQLEHAMAALFDQEQRQCAVRLVGMKAPVSLRTPHVPAFVVTPARLQAYVATLLSKWDFAFPREQAVAELDERLKAIELELRRPLSEHEPQTSRRRIDA